MALLSRRSWSLAHHRRASTAEYPGWRARGACYVGGVRELVEVSVRFICLVAVVADECTRPVILSTRSVSGQQATAAVASASALRRGNSSGLPMYLDLLLQVSRSSVPLAHPAVPPLQSPISIVRRPIPRVARTRPARVTSQDWHVEQYGRGSRWRGRRLLCSVRTDQV